VASTLSLFCNNAKQYVHLHTRPNTYPTKTNLIVLGFRTTVTVPYHIPQYFKILHVIPCVRQSAQYYFFTERKQLDYTKADKPSSISYPNPAADPSTFSSSAFILSFCFLNSVRKAKTFPGNLRNNNQEDALFYSKFISIINFYIFRAVLLLIIRRYYSVYTTVGLRHVGWLLKYITMHGLQSIKFPGKPEKLFCIQYILVIGGKRGSAVG
jgi:hypothetical protein